MGLFTGCIKGLLRLSRLLGYFREAVLAHQFLFHARLPRIIERIHLFYKKKDKEIQ
jgi:hypothetical protein